MVVSSNLLEEVLDIGRRLVTSGLVIGTWGNISFRTPENLVILTPSGMDYESLRVEDLVVLNLEGEVLKGSKKPSSEKDLHLEIYKNRSDVNSIIHTHSNYATAVAVVRIEIPPLTEDMVQLLGGSIKTAKYAPAGSKELANEAVLALGDLGAVLLANHGVVGVGRDLKEAMNVCLMVEKGAQLLINSKTLGSPFVIPDEDIKKMRSFFLTGYGQK